MQKYDVIIIGAGPAGLVSAKILSEAGKKVLLVEKNKIGGECTHTGCIPTKTLISCAKALHVARNLSQKGINASLKYDTKNVLLHVKQSVQKIYKEETPQKIATDNLHVIIGEAKFTSTHSIVANNTTYKADFFIIATGTSPLIPDIPKEGEVQFLHNENFWQQKKLPKKIAIIGGGVIAVEFADALALLGVHVDLIARGDRLLLGIDEDISFELTQNLIKNGVKIHLNTTTTKITKKAKKIELHVAQKTKSATTTKIIQTKKIFCATSRVPNSDLNLERPNIKKNDYGIVVSENLQTSQKHIYAIGDVSSPYRFTHAAEYEATIAAANILIPNFVPYKKKTDYSHMGRCIYTSLPYASIGLSEKEATAQFLDAQIHTCQYNQIDRAICDAAETGFIKIITKDDLIIGAHILGENAGELIHILALAKFYQVAIDELAHIIYIYPNYSDVIKKPAKLAYIKRLQNLKITKFIKILLGKDNDKK